MAVDAVHEQQNRGEDVLERHLPATERGARGDGELALAGFALEQPAHAVFIDRITPTMGAERLSSVVRKADRPERGVGLVVAHASNLDDA